MPALKTHCRQMHLCFGIQETIYLLFHYASLHPGKDKLTILEFPAPKTLTTKNGVRDKQTIHNQWQKHIRKQDKAMFIKQTYCIINRQSRGYHKGTAQKCLSISTCGKDTVSSSNVRPSELFGQMGISPYCCMQHNSRNVNQANHM